jgi:hypothetical protein
MVYSTTDLNNTITVGTDTNTTSGTIEWQNSSVWLNEPAVEYAYGYIPDELDNILPIQGNPDGAKWLVSWAYKKKDPVAFFKSKNDMLKFVLALKKDERVIQKSIIIHKISSQYQAKEIRKLKRFWVKELTLKKEKK